jgi:hypothetical protein
MNDQVTVIPNESYCGSSNSMRVYNGPSRQRRTEYGTSETMHPPAVDVAVATCFEVTVRKLGSRLSVAQNERYDGGLPYSSVPLDASGGRSCSSLFPRCTGTFVDAVRSDVSWGEGLGSATQERMILSML